MPNNASIHHTHTSATISQLQLTRRTHIKSNPFGNKRHLRRKANATRTVGLVVELGEGKSGDPGQSLLISAQFGGNLLVGGIVLRAYRSAIAGGRDDDDAGKIDVGTAAGGGGGGRVGQVEVQVEGREGPPRALRLRAAGWGSLGSRRGGGTILRRRGSSRRSSHLLCLLLLLLLLWLGKCRGSLLLSLLIRHLLRRHRHLLLLLLLRRRIAGRLLRKRRMLLRHFFLRFTSDAYPYHVFTIRRFDSTVFKVHSTLGTPATKMDGKPMENGTTARRKRVVSEARRGRGRARAELLVILGSLPSSSSNEPLGRYLGIRPMPRWTAVLRVSTAVAATMKDGRCSMALLAASILAAWRPA